MLSAAVETHSTPRQLSTRVTKAMDAAEAQKKGLTAVGGGGGGGGASAAAGAAHAGASRIDDVVEAMQDVHKVNTVEKSSMDWDTYKVETGLGDEVEAAAKNGCVVMGCLLLLRR